MYTCICYGVTQAEVEDAITAGACTEDEVGDRCGAGTGCGSCLDRICELLRATAPDHGRSPLRLAG